MKQVCCVLARDVGIITKIIDGHPMRRISECRVRFVNFGRSFLSPAIYKSDSAKRIAMPGSVL